MPTKYHSLNRKISLISGILIIALLLLLNLLAVMSVQVSNGKSLRENYTTIVNSYAMYIQSSNSTYMQQIRSYSAADEMQTQDKQAKIDFIRGKVSSRSKDFVFVAYVDENGMAYFDDGTQLNISNEDFCKEILTGGKNQSYAYPVKFSNQSEIVVPISKRFLQDDVPGFVMVGIPVSAYQKKIAGLSIVEGGSAILVSRNGDIMGHTDETFLSANIRTIAKQDYKNLDNLLDHMLSDNEEENRGIEWTTANNGDMYFVTYRPIKSTTWAIGIFVTKNAVQSTANALAKQLLVVSMFIGALLITFESVAIHKALKPLKKVNLAVKEIASGEADLTKRLSIKANNEIGRLTINFNKFMDTLQGTMKDLKGSNGTLQTAGSELRDSTLKTQAAVTQINANIQHVSKEITLQNTSVIQTASAVAEIAHNISSLEQMIRRQSEGVEQASAAVERMISDISNVNQSVDSVAQSFDVIEKDAINGSEMQKAVNQRIIQIEEQSKKLKDANTAISNIAEQTNLLAMNAAIEAAHAGNSGLGFKVVADEIRKLSETSSKQSKQIGEQLQAIQELITDVGQSSSVSNQTFSTVAQNIKTTNNVMHSIKTTIDQQAEGSEQISSTLGEMNSLTSEVRLAATEMTTGNQTILEEIKHLQDITTELKTFVSEMDVGSENIQNSSQVLRQVSEKMQTVIQDVGSKINTFTT